MFREFGSYLKSVFKEGRLPIITIITILGITLFIFPQLGERLIQNEQIVRDIGVGILLLSLIFAHFSLYRKMSKDALFHIKDQLLLYQDKNLPNNAIELRYL